MFRPIKNFITYIQKSASGGGSIFGNNNHPPPTPTPTPNQPPPPPPPPSTTEALVEAEVRGPEAGLISVNKIETVRKGNGNANMENRERLGMRTNGGVSSSSNTTATSSSSTSSTSSPSSSTKAKGASSSLGSNKRTVNKPEAEVMSKKSKYESSSYIWANSEDLEENPIIIPDNGRISQTPSGQLPSRSSTSSGISTCLLASGKGTKSSELIVQSYDEFHQDYEIISNTTETSSLHYTHNNLNSSNEDNNIINLTNDDPLEMSAGSVDDLISICSDDQALLPANGEEFHSFDSSRQVTPTIDDELNSTYCYTNKSPNENTNNNNSSSSSSNSSKKNKGGHQLVYEEYVNGIGAADNDHDNICFINDDLVSVISTDGIAAPYDEIVEEYSHEEVVGAFIKVNHLNKPDVVLVNTDADMNSSLASDHLSEDPLATDTSFANETIDLIDTSSDSATEEDVEYLWENIDTGEKVLVGTLTSTKCSKKKTFLVDSIETTTTTNHHNRNHNHNHLHHHLNAQLLCEEQSLLPPPTHQLDEEGGRVKLTADNQEELRCDNSDSGLGSETSTLLQTTLTSPTGLLDHSSQLPPTQANTDSNALASPLNACHLASLPATLNAITTAEGIVEPPVTPVKRLRSNLKHRLDVEEDLNLDLTDSGTSMEVACKKPKRSINFEGVQVFYFPRQQGFGCVPSAGGCTLGMGSRHIAFKSLTLAEHAAELRRAHRLQLQDNPRGSSSDDSEESEEDYLSEGSGSDLDAETNGFLQPMSPKQRRALLKAAGVRKIDASEKAECRDIRNSREVCGCTCRDFCDPETCSCSQAGIKCQVDRVSFPCGCSRDACGNTVGRVEFNPARVRTHFIHTIMRLEMENRQQQNPVFGSSPSSSTAAASNVANASSVISLQNGNNQTNFYSSLQTQSNYSSGYASPAYLTDQNISTNSLSAFYQQTGTNGHYTAGGDLHLGNAASAQFQLDSLDSSLFAGNADATPAYGEIMPSYANDSSNGFHSLPYDSVGSVNLYSSYPETQALSSDFATSSNGVYSSCAVPSLPPYGPATTTAIGSDAHYQHVTTTATANAAANCLALNSVTSTITLATEGGGGGGGRVTTANAAATAATTTSIEATCSRSSNNSNGSSVGSAGSSDISSSNNNNNFMSLNSLIASSSRLTHINDLLQHNRDATNALVAVTKAPNSHSHSSSNTNNINNNLDNNFNNIISNNNNTSNGIKTETLGSDLNQSQKSANCNSLLSLESLETTPRSRLAFDSLPIVAVNSDSNGGKCGNGGSPSANPPQMEPPP